ncbi:MAG TPA: zinc ribbon domain-containing protein [Gemmatimonadales bacterium]|nr:zinc ribbon domain-containing protein [Gemmatimonadales bacterium]
MVMIRCPSCGQRTLDVASKCPKCGHVLMQNPLETSAGSELVSCRRCGKHISRHAPVCPYCGHHLQRARRAAAVGWALVVLGLIGAAAWGAYRAGYLDRLMAPPEAPAPEPATPQPVGPDRSTPNAAPIVVPPPDTTPVRPAPPQSQPQSQPPPAAAVLRTRWTTEWANVRQDRSIQSAVVRVLGPGVEVSVGRLLDGWWEYYENGAVRGYIANSVLASQRG